MKNFKLLMLFVFLISIGLISCNKSNNENLPAPVYDTIFPGEYFPAFPGSWWIYNNGDTMKVAGSYEVYIFNSAGYTAEPDYDTLVLPRLISGGIFNPGDDFAYVNGYSISKSSISMYRDPAFKGLLSTVEGQEFIVGGAFQNHKITGKTIKTETAIYIGDAFYQDVIVTIEFDQACVSGLGTTPEKCAHMREYYAKNVGLIRRDMKNDSVFNTVFQLQQYHVLLPVY